jgi:integrase
MAAGQPGGQGKGPVEKGEPAMSIHPEGKKWRVKYRIAGKQHSRTFDRKGDARTFDAEVTRRRQLGPLLAAELERDTMTLDQFVRGPWRTHAATLAAPTRAKYAWALEKHLSELLDEPLISIDVARLAEHQQLLLDRDATPSTVREALTRLSGILQVAVEHGRIPANPARALRKVPAGPSEEVEPLSPVELERLIAGFSGRDRAIALLSGHLGLRPIEIHGAPWAALHGLTFTVARSRTKRTASRTRVIAAPEVTARELKAWRLESGRPGDDEPIVGVMSPNALRLWGAKRLRPAVAAATGGRIRDATVYTLRHSHASALHYAGFTPAEAAERMGHGLGLHWRTYAHVVKAMSGTRYDGLDALISAARARAELRESSVTAEGRD